MVFWAPKGLDNVTSLTLLPLAYMTCSLDLAHSTEYLILFPVVVSLSNMPESPLMSLHLLQWTPSLYLWSPTHVRFSLWPLQPRGCQGCAFTRDLSCQVSTVHHDPFSPMFPHCQERTTWKTLAKFSCQLEMQPWPPLHHVPAQWPCANIFQKFPSRWC